VRRSGAAGDPHDLAAALSEPFPHVPSIDAAGDRTGPSLPLPVRELGLLS
jgi:hypothetical protein